jgi:hypothetical protein
MARSQSERRDSTERAVDPATQALADLFRGRRKCTVSP